ncbi:HipA domain-containing protein [Solimonas sp. SE-A11]|uniref:type II toxin-antitoxin system HipA family toxin n=1 Tax=Solimonas sp. SE-A11 TaxID=3054954 RepID=UPI00259C7C73|nr:HipA domain-containing protein [Solimonas sp. SE-A11]
MSDQCVVWSDVGGRLVRVGRAEIRGRSSDFFYVDPYADEDRPAIDPINLPLKRRTVYTTSAPGILWGVLNDAGPDSWGQKVLKAIDPEWFGRATAIDYLIKGSGYGVGSLMFSESPDIKPKRRKGIQRADINAAAEAAHAVEIGEVPRAQLRLLLQSSVSAGGMHPKVAVSDADGNEWLAKFKSVEDVIDTPRVEWASMQLARLCDIDAAEVTLSAMAERSALLVRRFDREDGIEHYASAHGLFNQRTLSAKRVGTWASYAGVAQLRRQLPGQGVTADVRQIFQRMVFNVMIGNTDDHARNHGFVMNAAGEWRLSRAFDVLPNFKDQHRDHALEVGPRGTEGSYENVMDGVAQFGLDSSQGARIIRDMAERVRENLPRLLTEARCAAADRDVVMARCNFPPVGL